MRLTPSKQRVYDAIAANDLKGLCGWLENKGKEIMEQALARRDTQQVMSSATADELQQSRRFAERMAGRKLRPMSKTDARKCATMQGSIANRLEAEAKQLFAWADMLRRACE